MKIGDKLEQNREFRVPAVNSEKTMNLRNDKALSDG